MARTARVAVAALALMGTLAACGADPAPPAAAPPAPVAPVGADGQPLNSLCDLLDANDFSQVAGITATEPTAKDATMTSATCEFGPNVKLTVASAPTVEAAMGAYQESLKTSWFANNVKQGPIGGVDQSIYGSGPDAAALSVRRLKLVVTIVVPAKPDSEASLVQLTGRLLARANALGS
jgi:hypothetical protein